MQVPKPCTIKRPSLVPLPTSFVVKNGSKARATISGGMPAPRAGISRVDVWSTDKMPIDNSDAAAELQPRLSMSRFSSRADALA
jgi:hypothetical protein